MESLGLDFVVKGAGRVESFNEGLDVVFGSGFAGLVVLDNLLRRLRRSLVELRLKVGDSLLLLVAEAVFLGERVFYGVELRHCNRSCTVFHGQRFVGENSRQEGVSLDHCGGNGIGGRFEE